MLTVATVLRSGGVYDSGWVSRLKVQVEEYLPVDHKFVCLSDVDIPCERVPLEHNWPGWWSKMELFLHLDGPVLYFDLDTLILGDLRDIADKCYMWGSFWILRDFYRPTGLGSGVMGWSNRSVVEQWGKTFSEDPQHWMGLCQNRGDQNFIERQEHRYTRTWQDVLPGQFVSYKADKCYNVQPPHARVLCFHGKPKPPDLPPDNWARRYWDHAGERQLQ